MIESPRSRNDNTSNQLKTVICTPVELRIINKIDTVDSPKLNSQLPN